jgi:cell division septum initiation protein DivIVA
VIRLGEVRSPGRLEPGMEARGGSGGASAPADGWPAEVRQLLQNMDREATSLRAERRALSARVAELEQQLAMAEADTKRLADQVAELQARARAVPPVERQTNERWVTDVTENAAVTLRSAQEAAQRTVRRAKERATEIEQTALQEAAELRKRAEAQAEKLLLVAQYDAEGLLQGAQASAEEILVRARQRSERVLTALEERRASVEAEIQSL